MLVAPNVLVSMMSAPASRYSRWMPAMISGWVRVSRSLFPCTSDGQSANRSPRRVPCPGRSTALAGHAERSSCSDQAAPLSRMPWTKTSGGPVPVRSYATSSMTWWPPRSRHSATAAPTSALPMRRASSWLIALPLALGGSQLAHAEAYRLVYADPHERFQPLPGQAGYCAKGKTENPSQRLLGPVFLGHVVDCRPHEAADAEKAAMVEQAGRLTLTSRAFHNDQLALFYEEIAALTGSHKVLPMNSGAEAVESAIKSVRKWGYEVKGVPAGAVNTSAPPRNAVTRIRLSIDVLSPS
mgnify:CR=1 FL=1